MSVVKTVKTVMHLLCILPGPVQAMRTVGQSKAEGTVSSKDEKVCCCREEYDRCFKKGFHSGDNKIKVAFSVDEWKYCCKVREKECDEKYPKPLSSLTPGNVELIEVGHDSLAVCSVAETLMTTTPTTTEEEIPPLVEEEVEAEVEDEDEDEVEEEMLSYPEYEDVSGTFGGAKEVALESGSFQCCCRVDDAGEDIMCTVKNAADEPALSYKKGCGGLMGIHYHSYMSIEHFPDLPHRGQCWTKVSTLPDGFK